MRLAFLAAPVVALAALTAACNQSEPAAAPEPAAPVVEAPVQTPAVQGQATPPDDRAIAPPSDRSCLDEIGQEAATRLAEQCRAVSPATRPPCNTANPCAMIQSEIDRACALWERDGNPPDECRAG